MRAVLLTAHGGPEVLQPATVPDPEPGPGQVRVDLVRAALNHRDVWIREGRPGPLPAILGSDGAGVVSEVGAGVQGLAAGDEVVINPSLDWGEDEDEPGPDFRILGRPDQGTYAERIVVAAHQVRPRPAGWSWDECAALPLAGLTAWRALRLAGAGPGRRILVTGAGGGVATFLVQIGAALGATIRATSGSDPKVARALELGAETAVDYHDPDWPRADRAGRTRPSTARAGRASTPSSGRWCAAASSSASATPPGSRRRSTWPRFPRMAPDPGDDDGEPARVRRAPGPRRHRRIGGR